MTKDPRIILFQKDEVVMTHPYMLSESLPKDVSIQSVDYDLKDLMEKYTFIGSGGLPSSSSMYFLHPFKQNTYVEQSMAEDYLVIEKIAIYSKIAALLGAKSVKTEVVFIEANSYTTNANGGVSSNKVNVDIGYKKETVNKFSKSINVLDVFEQTSNFDLQNNISTAKKLVKDCFLEHEIQLVNLIDARDNSNSGVLQNKKIIKTELTSEVNSMYELSLNVKSPVFSLNSSFGQKLEKINTLSLEMEFEF